MFGFTTVEQDLLKYMQELEEREKEDIQYYSERIECAECGEIHERGDMNEIGVNWYCKECEIEHFPRKK